jgi:hypothetical protein
VISIPEGEKHTGGRNSSKQDTTGVVWITGYGAPRRTAS